MKKQAIEQTQFNEIKELISNYAISDTVKQTIINLEPENKLEIVLEYQKETGEALAILETKQSIPFMASEQIDRLFQKIEKGYILEPKELLEISEFLRTIRKLKDFFNKNNELAPTLAGYASKLQSFRSIEETINISIKHNQVSSEASRDLKKARQSIQKHKSDINDRIHKFINNASNKSKIQEFMPVDRDGTLTVPVKSSFKHSIKGRIVSESGKGSTVYIELDNTRELNQKLQISQAEEMTIVYQILANLTEEIAKELVAMEKTMTIIFSLELIVAKAKYSEEIEGNKVKINETGYINLINAKHPLLGKSAVPLSIELGETERGLVITGSNSGGKTVVLKTVGLLTLMTMIGLYIPADSTSNISIFDHILVDIGDYQDFDNALSTFSGHINNMREILSIADEKSLILVDEIGSGTEPTEGAALATAMLESLVNRQAVVLASTHYGEIKDFAVKDRNFITAAMAFDKETLNPLYQLLMNEVGASNGFWLAKKMNIGKDILERATFYLTKTSL
jgi:dsDNA-specific endonuclease/ATPase MutS2